MGASERGACWRCAWFDRLEGEEADGGFCRRYPPQPDMEAIVWPGVGYLDWCGEYREREEDEPCPV